MSSELIHTFSQWIKARRKLLDLTQESLARQVGCSLAAIKKIESGERRPSRQIAGLLAEHLQLSPTQRPVFVRVARGELSLERLTSMKIVSTGSESSNLPAAQSPAQTRSLPVPANPLVGREYELAEIMNLLQDPHCRLLTLTGQGGIGKTRLALEAASQLQDRFSGGVFFVSLVGISSPEFIIPAVADAMELTFAGSTDPKAQLFHYLKEKQTLFVLDNLEHLLAGIGWLSELLQFAPGIKILATSREQLHLQAEWSLEVQGLPVPQSNQPEAVQASSSVALFLQRARQLRVGFTATADESAALVRICQLVQGLPLAIELAAAWTRILSCREIANEIERGLDILAATMLDVPERHRSIRAVFDHSWNLLSPEEQGAMRRLSVFRGGFRREAAEQVAGASLPVLSVLVAKSLVRRSTIGHYDLHGLVCQYMTDRLREDADEDDAACIQHSCYYLTLLATHTQALTSGCQKETFAELNADIDNIRAAWDTAVARAQIDLLRHATWPMYYFYELHNYFQEGEVVFRRGAEMARTALANLGSDCTPKERKSLEYMLGDMMMHQAFFNLRLGRNNEAITLYHSSIVLLQQQDDRFTLAHALLHYGFICWIVGDFNEASRSLQEGLPLSQTLDHPWLKANFSTALGVVAHEKGEYTQAYHRLSEGVAIARSTGDPHLMSFCGSLFMRTAQTVGRVAQDDRLLEEGLHLVKEIGDRWSIGLRLERMAVTAQTAGDPVEACRLFDESVALYKEIGDQWGLSRALNLKGYFSIQVREYTLAQESFLQALQIALAAGVNPNVLDALAGLAILFTREDQSIRALELAALILQHPASTQDTKDRTRDLREELVSRLGSQQSAAALALDRARPFDEVVKELLT